jgi:hypothetical protein
VAKVERARLTMSRASAFVRALNRHVERVFDPSRKVEQAKLARDR